MGKKLLAIFLVISTILLTAVVAINVIDAYKRQIASEKALRYEEEVRSYRIQKAQYINQYGQVENEVLGEATVFKANLSMVFLGVSSALYYEIFPLMYSKEADKNVKGTICLSRDELPGMEGKISKAQYFEMVSDGGWDTALFWEGCDEKRDENNNEIDTVAALVDFLDDMTALLSEYGLDFPDTVVFKNNNTYNYKTMDTVLEQYGIRHAVLNCEEKLALIEHDVYDDETVMHPGAIGWQVQTLNGKVYGKNIFVEDLINLGGAAAFTVSFFPPSHPAYSETHYYGSTTVEQISFEKMVEYIRGRMGDTKLTVSGIHEAFLNRAMYLGKYEELAAEITAIKQEIQAQITEIDLKMKEIADKYFKE